MADLAMPELVENQRRSIAMLAAGARALNRDEALDVLDQLVEALRKLRRPGPGLRSRDAGSELDGLVVAEEADL